MATPWVAASRACGSVQVACCRPAVQVQEFARMLRFILRRLGMAMPTLLLISVTVFVLIRLDPRRSGVLMLGDMARRREPRRLRRTWAWTRAW